MGFQTYWLILSSQNNATVVSETNETTQVSTHRIQGRGPIK